MDKYINLGTHIESTGERRVNLIDDTLVKIASNDIQNFWDTMLREPGKAYLHVLAMTAKGWYTCNSNGDAFYEDDLIKYHPTFVSDANLFMLHKNKDPANGYGKPVYSFYNKKMHRVELIIAVDKQKAPGIVRSIENDEDIAVSMGARVKHDICSICGNVAKTRGEYCDCLRYNMKKILKDGRQVYAINPGPITFFDISVVRRPADTTAWALQKAASDQSCDFWDDDLTSVERGEKVMLRHEKQAAISKLGDMIKDVDCKVVNTGKGIPDMDVPEMSFTDMEALKAMPGCVLKSIVASGVAPSLSEMAFITGRHAMGDDFSEEQVPGMLGSLPSALKMLQVNPDFMDGALAEILGNDGGMPVSGSAMIIIKPVAEKRITLIKNMAEPDDLERMEKSASEALTRLPVPKAGGAGMEYTNLERIFSTAGPALSEKYTVEGEDGLQYSTTRNAAKAAHTVNQTPRMLKGALGAALGLAALSTGFSDAKLTEKLLITPILAALSAGVLHSNESAPAVETAQGAEVPVNAFFSEGTVKEAMRKQAGAAQYMAPAFGAAVPGVLGLDYLYNKKVKHKDNPYFEQQAAKGRAVANKAGRAVMDNPLASVTGGAVAASALKYLLRAKFGLA